MFKNCCGCKNKKGCNKDKIADTNYEDGTKISDVEKNEETKTEKSQPVVITKQIKAENNLHVVKTLEIVKNVETSPICQNIPIIIEHEASPEAQSKHDDENVSITNEETIEQSDIIISNNHNGVNDTVTNGTTDDTDSLIVSPNGTVEDITVTEFNKVNEIAQMEQCVDHKIEEHIPYKSIMKRGSTVSTSDADKTKNGSHTSEYVTNNLPSNCNGTNEKITQMNLDDDDDDDDEVFCSTVAPPRTEGTCKTPHPAKRSSVPRLSALATTGISLDEDEVDAETGGICEPPATPVGKDELALRRHRFFSELMTAARAASEHRVSFDPLGPTVAATPLVGLDANKENTSVTLQLPTAELECIVSRLECVATRLEHTATVIAQISPSLAFIKSVNMNVAGYSDIIHGPLAQYVNLSTKIGGDVATHAQLVQEAFQVQLQYITMASNSKCPEQSQIVSMLQPTSLKISNIQNLREKNRTSPYFNHLSAISESIPALGWVTITPAPAPYIKEMNDAGQFYTNRVLKDWKEKDKTHVDWVKAWIQTLTDLQQYVKQYHTTGLVWAGKSAPAPPMLSGGAPPPPPMMPLGDIPLGPEGDMCPDDRAALFAQINQGEGITKSLKKVTSDMQTHKNPTLRTGPAPFKTPTTYGTTSVKPPVGFDKTPSFVRDGKKWLIEYQKGNHDLIVDNAEMNNVVYMYKCDNSTLTVKGKLNSVVLDSCKKSSVVFDTLVSSIEFINCQSVQMQVLGKVPTITIDKTDGCQMYLSNDSLDVEIISSKSSEMNVLVPKSNGDYSEHPIPEQFKTTVSNKGLHTIIVESKG